MNSHIILFFLVGGGALVGCAHQSNPPPYSQNALAAEVNVAPLDVVAENAWRRLQQPYVLAGEDVESIVFDFNANLLQKNDSVLLSEAAKIPAGQVGSLYYFIPDKTAARVSHPTFMAMIEERKIKTSPAIKATVLDAASS